MNNLLKKILVVILISLTMFSSLMIHIYNTTSVDYNVSIGNPLSSDEIVIYNVYIYILCISALLLAIIWYYSITSNKNLDKQ
jgi:uncharacterized BrkB/YihY/UPF0761 family membrane protein